MALAMGMSLFVSSCNDNGENGIDDARGELVPVVFDSPSINMITRATETEFGIGDAINITAVNKSVTDSENIESDNYADNVKYVCDGTEFIAEDKPILNYSNPKAANVLVYYATYPYKENLTPQFTFSVGHYQNTNSSLSNSDLSMQKYASKAHNVNLQLKHMLCNVEIMITGTDLDQKMISGGRLVNMYHTVTADQNTQTVTTDLDSNKRHSTIYGNVTRNSDTEYRFRAIVAPQTIEANQHFVSILLGSIELELRSVNAVTLKSGRKYIFAYNLDGNDVGSNLNVGYAGVDDIGNQTPAARMVSSSEWE